VLCEGNAIRLHPVVCKAFNADFDGDQMAVHLPLSIQAQVEAKVLMMPTSNILSPAGGQPIISPSQDIVLGCHYLTADFRLPIEACRLKPFANPAEVILAHEQGKVGLHECIAVRLPPLREVICEGDQSAIENRNTKIATTVGRVLFNDILPERMPFYNLTMTASTLPRVVSDCHARLGKLATVELLDRLKTLGFHHATKAGISFSVEDLHAPLHKEKVLARTWKQVEKVRQGYMKGDLTDTERALEVVKLW